MQALQTFDLRDQEIDSGFMNHKPLISTLVFIVFSVYVYTHKYVYIYIDKGNTAVILDKPSYKSVIEEILQD